MEVLDLFIFLMLLVSGGDESRQHLKTLASPAPGRGVSKVPASLLISQGCLTPAAAPGAGGWGWVGRK